MFCYDFFRLPFDWRTPFGYLVAIAFEFVSIFGIFSNAAPSACFAIGASIWMNAFLTGIAQNVNDLNAMNYNPKHKNFKEMKKRFSDIIQDFSDVKEFSDLSCLFSICKFSILSKKN